MGFNVSGTKNVRVRQLIMKPRVSDGIIFGDLQTDRKKKTRGKEHSSWEGRFVGDAFEKVKTLEQNARIDILDGWVEKDECTREKDGRHFEKFYVTINDFALSEA